MGSTGRCSTYIVIIPKSIQIGFLFIHSSCPITISSLSPRGLKPVAKNGPRYETCKTQPAILPVLVHQPNIFLPLRHPFMQ